ncbi:MAG TPA: hypothetical protein VME63_17885 [Dyella sp.]|uniref:hypothetical protein n=1 Tax=Dyella sp. TaxID=1869338 RepID=UPI002C818A2A|nr:hypothetical protein [Dyella sp.]HTV87271.1 hypothetical protein [Dyella sp.]
MDTNTNVNLPNPVYPLDGYVRNDYQNAAYQTNLFSNMSTVLGNTFSAFNTVAGGPNTTSMLTSGAAGISALLAQAQGLIAAAAAGDPQAAMEFQLVMERYKALGEAVQNGIKTVSDVDSNAIRNAAG